MFIKWVAPKARQITNLEPSNSFFLINNPKITCITNGIPWHDQCVDIHLAQGGSGYKLSCWFFWGAYQAPPLCCSIAEQVDHWRIFQYAPDNPQQLIRCFHVIKKLYKAAYGMTSSREMKIYSKHSAHSMFDLKSMILNSTSFHLHSKVWHG